MWHPETRFGYWLPATGFAEQSVPIIFSDVTCTALMPSAVDAAFGGSLVSIGGINDPVISTRCPMCLANSFS